MLRLTIPFLITALLACSVSAQYPVDVGELHPDFKLPNVEDGEPVSLSDYRGKKVLLIHFASW